MTWKIDRGRPSERRMLAIRDYCRNSKTKLIDIIRKYKDKPNGYV